MPSCTNHCIRCFWSEPFTPHLLLLCHFISACGENVKKGSWFHGCRPCDYDLCNACYTSYGGKGTPSNKGSSKTNSSSMGQPPSRDLQALVGKNAAERADWANTGTISLTGSDSHLQHQQLSLGFGSVYSLGAHGDPPLALLAATAALLGEPRSITRASAAAAGATLATGLEAVAEKLGVPRLLDANEFLHEECVLLFLAELVRHLECICSRSSFAPISNIFVLTHVFNFGFHL